MQLLVYWTGQDVYIVFNSDGCAAHAGMVAELVGVQVAMACGMEWNGPRNASA